ncbi:MAG: heavy metal-associated domain-containing protein, partial [bacterium]|nr:heavy metal-associated domain-containing protein [bacterium]
MPAQRLHLPIRGMSCAGCASRSEHELQGLSGVAQAQVNFATEKATVVYIPSQVETQTLRQAIKAAGYEPL